MGNGRLQSCYLRSNSGLLDESAKRIEAWGRITNREQAEKNVLSLD